MAKVVNPKNKLHISKPKSKNYFNFSKLVCLVLIALSSLFVYLLSNRRGNPELVKIIYLVSFGINMAQIVYVLYRWLFELSGRYNKKGRSIEKLLSFAWIGLLFVNVIIASILFEALRLDLALIFGCQVLSMFLLIKISSKIDFKVNKSFSEKDLDQRNPAFDKKRNFSKLFRYVVIVTLIVVIELATLFVLPKWPQKIDDIFNENRVLQYTRITGNDQYVDGYYVKDVYIGTSTTIVIPKEYNGSPVVGILEGAIKDPSITSIQFGEYNAEGVLESNLQVIETKAVEFGNISEITIPSSVKSIAEDAFVSKSLKTVNFEADARLSLGSFEAELLETVNINTNKVITVDFEGHEDVIVNVDKELYNDYRRQFNENRTNFNIEDEQNKYIVIDFETSCDEYIESRIVEMNSNLYGLLLNDLKNEGQETNSLIKDTLLYNENHYAFEGFSSNDGYVFRGWYRDSTFIEECDISNNEPVYITEDTTIYAKWVKVKTLVLDWGAYRPYDQQYTELLYIDTQYDEDNRNVPTLKSENGEVAERLGFNKLSWVYNDGTEEKVIKSTKELFGIEEDFLTVKAVWDLNLPDVTYKTLEYFNGDEKEYSASGMKFTFDEERKVVLDVNAKHISPEVTLSYKVYKEGANEDFVSVPNNNVNFNETFHDVIESGNYKIEVLATAKTGETATVVTSYKVDIEKKDLNIDSYLPEHEKVVYNGKSQDIPFEKESLIPSDVFVTKIYKYDGIETAVGPVNVRAQSYEVDFKFEKMGEEKDNYNVYTYQTTLTILPKEVDVRWEQTDPKFNENFEVTYNGGTHKLIPNVVGICGDDTVEFTFNKIDEGVNVGKYITIINGVNNSNYVLKKDVENSYWEHTFDIVPLKLTSTWSSNITNVPTYNGLNQVYSLTINGIISTDLNAVEMSDFTFNSSEATNPAIKINNTSLVIDFSFKDAGTYEVSIEKFTFNNYQFDTMETNIVINKAPLIGVFSENADKYDGLVKTKYLTVSGFKGDDLKSFDLENDFDISYGDLAVKLDNSGKNAVLSFDATYANDYKITLKEILNKNYYISEQLSTTFKIDKVALNGTWDLTNVTYNGLDQVFSYTIPGMFKDDADKVKIQDFVIASDLEVIGVETSELKGAKNNLKDLVIKVKAKNAGTYNFTLSELSDAERFPGNGSYILVNEITKDININKLLVELEWSDTTLTYNSKPQTVVPTIINVCGDDIVNITTIQGNIETVVGTYHSLVTELDNPNYCVDLTSSVDWTINNKKIEVSYNDKEETYDGKYHYIELVYSGFETSDLSSIEKGDFTYNLDSNKTFVFDQINIDHVGNKVIAIFKAIDADEYSTKLTSFEIPNYELEVEKAYNLTIKPLELVFSWDYTSEYTYNGVIQSVNPTIDNLCVREDTSVLDVCNISLLTSSSAINVGNYTAEIKEVDNSNYYINNSLTSTIDWKIVPKKLTYVFSENEVVYNGNDQVVTLTISGYVNGEEAKGSTRLSFDNEKYLGTNQFLCFGSQGESSEFILTFKAKNADTYPILVTNVDSNYELEDMVTDFVIEQKVVEIMWEDNDFTYNAQPQFNKPIAMNACGLDEVNFAISISQNGSMVTEWDNAGDYLATIVNCTNNNYKLPDSGLTNEYTIKKRTLTVSSENNGQELEYNGSNRYMIIKVEGFQSLEDSNNFKTNKLYESTTNTESTVQLSNNSSNYGYVNITIASKNANDNLYSFVISAIKDDNYTISESYEHTFRINKRVLSVSWNGANVVYNGEIQYVTPVYGNICTNNGDVINATYSATGSSYLGGIIGETANFARDAGEYEVTLTSVDNSNYTIEGSSNLTTSFIISQKNLAISFDNPSLAYNGNYQGVVATHGEIFASDANLFASNPFIYSANEQKVVYTGGSNSISFSAVNNGIYDVVITGLVGECANYTLVGTLEKHYAITKRTIEVSWSADKLVYNGLEQSITPTITNLCTNALSGMTDVVTLTISGDKYTNSGSYNAQISEIDEVNDNYALVTPINKTWEISKQELTMQVEKGDVTFDGKYHYLTVTITGFNNQEDLDTINVNNVIGYMNPEVVKDYENKTIVLSCKAIDFGTYKFHTGNVSFNDYTIQSDLYSFDIFKAPIEVVWKYNTATYNGLTQVVSCLVNPISIFEREDGGVEDTTLQLTNTQNANAGNYTASAVFSNTSNYNITNGTYDWVIEKAPLTVSFSGEATYSYDATEKIVKLMVSGFQGSESGLITNFITSNTSGLSITKLDDEEQGVTIFNLSATNANIYEFTLSDIKSGHLNNYYLVESKSNSFEITPAKLTANWSLVNSESEYTGLEQSVVLTISGFQGTDASSVGLYTNMYGSVKPVINRSSDVTFTYTVKNAGEYSLELNNFDDRYTNYQLDDLQTSFKINPKELSVEWSYNEEVIYSSEYNSVLLTLNGFVNGEEDYITYNDFSFSYDLNNGGIVHYGAELDEYSVGVGYKNVGVHTTTFNGILNGNYCLAEDYVNSVTFEVKPAPLTVEFIGSGSTYTYNGNNQGITVDIKGFKGDDQALSSSFEWETNATLTNYLFSENVLTYSVVGKDVASYNVTLKGIKENHLTNYYLFSQNSASFEIEKAQLVANWNLSNNQNIVYDGLLHEITLTVTGFANSSDAAKTPYNALYFINSNEPTKNYVNATVKVSDTTATYSYLLQNVGEYTCYLCSFDDLLNNYSLSAHELTYTIQPKELTVSWNVPTDVVYDGDEKYIELNINGFENNEGTSLSTNILGIENPTKSTQRNGSSWTMLYKYVDAGTYNLAIDEAATTFRNYVLKKGSVLDTTLYIEQATYDMSGVTFNNQTVVYDGYKHALTISGSLPSGVKVSYTTFSLKDVGTIDITASFTGDDNHYPIDSMSASLTITPRPLTLEWSYDAETAYDGNAKTISLTLNGFVNNDGNILSENSFVLESDVTTWTRNSASWNYTFDYLYPGNYVVEVKRSNINFSNYVLSDDAILTAAMTIDKGTYDMSGVVFENMTVEYDGQVHELVVTGTLPEGVTVSYGNSQTSRKDVGVSMVYATFTGDSNYYPIEPMLRTLNITRKELVGAFNLENSYEYDGLEKTMTYVLVDPNNLIDMNEITVNVPSGCTYTIDDANNTITFKATEAGSYDVSLEYNDGNCNITNVSQLFVINGGNQNN